MSSALHTESLGESGPAVLVLHGGLGWDSASLRPWLDPLADAARLTLVDLPGCGSSPDPADWDRVTHAALADAVEGARQQLDADGGGHGRVVVLGHSYGAVVALEYAARYPDRVDGLVLVAPPSRAVHLGAAAARAETIAESLPPAVGTTLGEALSRPPETDAEFAAWMGDLLPLYVADPAAHDLAAFAGRVRFRAAPCRRSFYGLLADYDARAVTPGVDAPALVVSGRHDWVCPPDEGPAEVADGLGAEHVVFERSGHLPFLEEPARFVGVVGTWLSERTPVSDPA